MGFTNGVHCTLLLLISIGYGANSLMCPNDDIWRTSTICGDDEYCCGFEKEQCCKLERENEIADLLSQSDMKNMLKEFLAFVVVVMIVFCPIYCCYRCCCRRTTQQGFVYSPADNTTSVTVSLPPHQAQVPYPSVMPYPQQTPYPPQQPTNPYFGGPPPPYHVAQGSFQNASAPTL